MIITYASIVVAGGPGDDGAADFKFGDEPVVQTAQFLRGVSARPISRGNVVTRVSCTVSRLFGSMGAAGYFAITHPKSLPLSGDLVITSVDDDGRGASATIKGAARGPCTCTRKGVTVFTSYTWTGPALGSGGAGGGVFNGGSLSLGNGIPSTFGSNSSAGSFDTFRTVS